MGDKVSMMVSTGGPLPRVIRPDDELEPLPGGLKLGGEKLEGIAAGEQPTDAVNKAQMEAADAVVAARALVLERQVLQVSQYAWGAEGDAPGGANTRLLSVSIRDAAGHAPLAPAIVAVQPLTASDASFNLTDGGKGAVAQAMNATTKKAFFSTDANGDVEILVTDTAAETVLIGVGGDIGTDIIHGTMTNAVFA